MQKANHIVSLSRITTFVLALCCALAVSASTGLIIQPQECGFLSFGPDLLCGGLGGGVPVRFIQTTVSFPADGLQGITTISIGLFLLNTIVWLMPFVLLVLVIHVSLPFIARRARWSLGLLTALLLAPVWLRLIVELTARVGLRLPPEVSGSIVFLPEVVAARLTSGDLSLAVSFTYLLYGIILSFIAVLLCFPAYRQLGRQVFVYPATAIMLLLITRLLTDSMLAAPFSSPAQAYPFTVDKLAIVTPDAGKPATDVVVEYALTFHRLPQENTIYEVRYAVSDAQILNEQHEVGHGQFVDYLKQVTGTIYAKAPNTTLYDNQFVAHSQVSGRIQVQAERQPSCLFVIIGEHQNDAGIRFSDGYRLALPATR